MHPDGQTAMGDGIQFVAPTHLQGNRTVDWYWALGIIALLGAAFSVIWGDLLFAGIIVLGAISIIVMAAREPRQLEVAITSEGIHIDHDFYPYSSIHSFWVAEHPHKMPKLFLATRGLIHPHIAIPLIASVEPWYVRAFLSQHVSEESGHSFGSWFVEFLGF